MATRTISNAGGNWTTVGTWVEGAVPTNADNVVATATSGNLVLNTTCDCATCDLTGYTGTLSGSGFFRIFGGVITLGGTITSTSNIQLLTVAPTVTSNGITWTGSIQFPGLITTIVGDLYIDGNIIMGNQAVNGDNIYFKGNLTVNGNAGGTPTSIFTANGTGNQTWSGNFSLSQPLVVNKPSGDFIISGSVSKRDGAFTRTAGNIDATGSTIIIPASVTLDLPSTTLNNLTRSGTSTITLISDLTIGGNYLNSGGSNTFNGANVYFGGNITMTAGNIANGTATLIYNGTGIWSGTVPIQEDFTINTAGTLTISGNVAFNTSTLTYTSGTIITTGSTLTIVASTTLNTNGITWNNVNITATATITNNSLLTVNSTLTLANAAITFAGTHGFTTNTLTTATLTVNRAYILASTKTYYITTNFTSNANTNTIRPTFRSSIAGSQAILTLSPTATQDLKFVNATDIDSSLGQQVVSNKGTLSNATNWYRTNGTFMYLMQQ